MKRYYPELSAKTYFSTAVCKMIHEGIIKEDTYNLNLLNNFIKNVYMKCTRKEKEAIYTYIRLSFSIEDFSIEKALKIRSENVCKKGMKKLKEKINLMTEDERKEYRRKITVGQILSKEHKYKDLSPKESKRKVYINGLITKGKKEAIVLNLDLSKLTDKDFLKLSGRKKKQSHDKRTEEEKNSKRIQWIRKNLINKNIISLLVDEFPEFSDVNVEKITNDEAIVWYGRYNSIRVCNSLINERGTRSENSRKKWKCGFFDSIKNNKRMYYRSSFELKTLQFLEDLPKIVSFDTEPFKIKYFHPIKKEIKFYVPDIIFKIKDYDEDFLLEVKPLYMLEEFNTIKRDNIAIKIIVITEDQIKSKEIFYEYIEENCKK